MLHKLGPIQCYAYKCQQLNNMQILCKCKAFVFTHGQTFYTYTYIIVIYIYIYILHLFEVFVNIYEIHEFESSPVLEKNKNQASILEIRPGSSSEWPSLKSAVNY